MSIFAMKKTAALLGCSLLIAAVSGCSYLKNRGNDLVDIIDVGLTIGLEREPGVALYAQVTPIAPLGFSKVEGAYLGLADREAGALFIDHSAYGLLLWGQEALGIGTTELAAEGRSHPYGQGVARLAQRGDNPFWKQWGDIEAAVHIGWFGVHARVKPMQAVDFITGLFTWDMLGDNTFPKPDDVER